jgi:CheY-like chemotaxis protein
VLIVDDERDAAIMMAVLVQQLGQIAETAFDGDSALQVAKSFKPHVVFVDLVLPDADGCELAVAIRQLPGLESCRVFALTAYGSAEDRLRTMGAGCEAHYVKPLDPAILPSLLGLPSSN